MKLLDRMRMERPFNQGIVLLQSWMITNDVFHTLLTSWLRARLWSASLLNFHGSKYLLARFFGIQSWQLKGYSRRIPLWFSKWDSHIALLGDGPTLCMATLARRTCGATCWWYTCHKNHIPQLCWRQLWSRNLAVTHLRDLQKAISFCLPIPLTICEW